MQSKLALSRPERVYFYRPVSTFDSEKYHNGYRVVT